MEKFIDYIQSLVPNCSVAPLDLEDFFSLKSLAKGEILLSMGSICKHYYFVNQGVLKIYYFNDLGEERTSWVAFEGYFFTELESFTKGTPSQYEIIATETTEVLQIHKAHIDLLIEKYDWFAKFLFYNQQETILNLTKIIELFQNQSAKDRYKALFSHPDFIQKVKQKDLASMLGMSKYSMSRVRKER
ncbi:Crp/Fnr family transcriptional regulator [Capnocytophaga canis]|uniref:Crp/Fnr family transcriptional regulator n=2 Tax=Capnocytophaga canis TaxID=1848903 RepID=UPI001562AD46|nr:Crp/Fnr family transcriptional regulator [Capnocytophaga canis]